MIPKISAKKMGAKRQHKIGQIGPKCEDCVKFWREFSHIEGVSNREIRKTEAKPEQPSVASAEQIGK